MFLDHDVCCTGVYRVGTPGPAVPYEEKKSINGTLSEYLCNIILYHGFEVCISNMRPEPQDSSPR